MVWDYIWSGGFYVHVDGPVTITIGGFSVTITYVACNIWTTVKW